VGLGHLEGLLKPPPRDEVPAVVAVETVYQGEMAVDILRLSVTRRVKIRSKTRAWVILGEAGSLIGDLQSGVTALASEMRPDGQTGVWLASGAYVLRYTMQIAIPKQRGEHQLALRLPPSASSRMTLRFVGKDWSLHTKPASWVGLREEKGQTYADINLPNHGDITLYWKGKRVERSEQTRFRSTIQTRVTLRESLMQVESDIVLPVLTGSLRQIRCVLPADLEVLHIGGKGVTEWFPLRREGGEQTIQIQLAYPVRDEQRLNLRMERSGLGGQRSVALPAIKILDSEETSGFVGVQAQADTEVSHEDAQGAVAVDIRSLEGVMSQESERPILLAYRFEQAAWQIRVGVIKHPPLKVMSIVINRASFDTVYTRSGREVTKATWWVTNNRQQYMSVELPKGSSLLGAFVAQNAVQVSAKKDAKGREMLLLPLVRSKSRRVGKSFAVELLYSRQEKSGLRDAGVLALALPRTPLEVLSYQWAIYLSRSHRVIWEAGDARSPHRRRFFDLLTHRVDEDLRAKTPALWAGGPRKKANLFNRYSSMGLKDRFAAYDAPAAAPILGGRSEIQAAKGKAYRSRFAEIQWQVRAEIPLAGREIRLSGHLLRDKAPSIRLTYFHESYITAWFWLVLFLTLSLMVVFAAGIFASSGVRWLWLVGVAFGGMGLIFLGLFLPMTYLAGLRGIFFGVWAAWLWRLALLSEGSSSVLLSAARWWGVLLSFYIVLAGRMTDQIVAFFLLSPSLLFFLPAIKRWLISQEAADAGESGSSQGDRKGGHPPKGDLSATATTAVILFLSLGSLFGVQSDAWARTPYPPPSLASKKSRPIAPPFQAARQAQAQSVAPTMADLSLPSLKQTGEGVWLPLGVYLGLQKQAKQPKAHRSASIVRADYSASLDKKGILVEARLLIASEGDGWHGLPVLFEGYPLVSASWKGAQPLLAPSSAGAPWRFFWIKGGQRDTLALRFFVPYLASPDAQILFRAPQAAISALQVSFPAGGYRPTLTGGFHTKIAEVGGKTKLEALIAKPEEGVTLRWWQQALPDAVKKQQQRKQARLYARTYGLLSVAKTGQELFLTYRYTLVQAPQERFLLRVPKGLQIRNVRALGLRDYSVQPDPKGDGQILDVLLSEPVTERYEISILAELRNGGDFSLLLPEPLGVQREQGFLGIESVGNEEIHVEAKGASSIDVQELPAEIIRGTTRPLLHAFRYTRRPASWKLQVKRYPSISLPASIIDRAEYLQVVNETGQSWVQAAYRVRNSFKQFMAIQLPKGALLRSAFVDSRPVKPAKDAAGRVLIPLKRSGQAASRAFSVEVVYSLPLSPLRSYRSYRYDIPRVDLWISMLSWSLYLPEGRIMLHEGSLERGRTYRMARWEQEHSSDHPRAQFAQQALIQTKVAPNQQAHHQQMTSGVLPVRIDLPRIGRYFVFYRYHIPPTHPTPMSFRYLAHSLQIFSLFLLFFAGCFFSLALALFVVGARRAVYLLPLFFAVAGASFVFSLWSLAKMSWMIVFGGGLCGVIIALGVVLLQWSEKRKQDLLEAELS
jgi:hypothetical protein